MLGVFEIRRTHLAVFHLGRLRRGEQFDRQSSNAYNRLKGLKIKGYALAAVVSI